MLSLIGCVAAAADRVNADVEAMAWQPWEQALVSVRQYGNPFKDITVSVEYSGPTGAVLKGLAFWDVMNEPDWPTTPPERVEREFEYAKFMADVFHELVIGDRLTSCIL